MILRSMDISRVDQILQWKKHGKMLKMFLVKHFKLSGHEYASLVECEISAGIQFTFFWSVNKNFIEKKRKVQEKKQIPWYTGCLQGKQMSTRHYINLQYLKQRVCQDHS